MIETLRVWANNDYFFEWKRNWKTIFIVNGKEIEEFDLIKEDDKKKYKENFKYTKWWDGFYKFKWKLNWKKYFYTFYEKSKDWTESALKINIDWKKAILRNWKISNKYEEIYRMYYFDENNTKKQFVFFAQRDWKDFIVTNWIEQKYDNIDFYDIKFSNNKKHFFIIAKNNNNYYLLKDWIEIDELSIDNLSSIYLKYKYTDNFFLYARTNYGDWDHSTTGYYLDNGWHTYDNHHYFDISKKRLKTIEKNWVIYISNSSNVKIKLFKSIPKISFLNWNTLKISYELESCDEINWNDKIEKIYYIWENEKKIKQKLSFIFLEWENRSNKYWNWKIYIGDNYTYEKTEKLKEELENSAYKKHISKIGLKDKIVCCNSM